MPMNKEVDQAMRITADFAERIKNGRGFNYEHVKAEIEKRNQESGTHVGPDQVLYWALVTGSERLTGLLFDNVIDELEEDANNSKSPQVAQTIRLVRSTLLEIRTLSGLKKLN